MLSAPYGHSISDVLRRLLMVIGCVVLATAQPMSVFGADNQEKKITPDTVIFPKAPASGTASSAPSVNDGGGFSGGMWISLLIIAGGGAWWWWRNRLSTTNGAGASGTRHLAIEETRPLGNRQYLVVASYDGKKYLLGVTQGQISLLTPLPGDFEKKDNG